jgi:predicted NAD/FAD-binding protein
MWDVNDPEITLGRELLNVRIAIVGSGISGLVCAHLLHEAHEVVLFEAGDHVGGHTHTHDVEIGGRKLTVDTGFIVFNERTYPGFIRLLERLGVASQPSEMSFSVKDATSGLEWRGTNLDTLFAQRSNLFNRDFHRMVLDITRFNRLARELAKAPETHRETVGEFLERHDFSREFRDFYLVPLGTAVWSADPTRFDLFPAATLARFFSNHGFLQVSGQPAWRTVQGGSRRYVERIVASLGARVRRKAVISVRRPDDAAGGVEVTARGGPPERFDRVILACHSDQALGLLADPSPAEREILGAMPFQENQATLHTDASVMPRSRKAWGAWNAWIPPSPRGRATLTYDMVRLQSLDSPTPVLVSLNMDDRIDPAQVVRRLTYHHPAFSPASVQAQRRHAEIDGVRATHYCGAWWGYGFHEDGVQSALRVTRKLGADL